MFRGGEDRGDGEEREERGPWRGWIAGEGVGEGVRASALGGVEMSEASLGATDAPGDRVGLCGRGAWRGLVTGTGGVKYFAIRAGSIAGSAGLRRERGQGGGEMLHEVRFSFFLSDNLPDNGEQRTWQQGWERGRKARARQGGLEGGCRQGGGNLSFGGSCEAWGGEMHRVSVDFSRFHLRMCSVRASRMREKGEQDPSKNASLLAAGSWQGNKCAACGSQACDFPPSSRGKIPKGGFPRNLALPKVGNSRCATRCRETAMSRLPKRSMELADASPGRNHNLVLFLFSSRLLPPAFAPFPSRKICWAELWSNARHNGQERLLQ